MKMSVFLLLFTVTVLLSPAVTSPAVTRPQFTPNPNLKTIIVEAELYNKSLTKDYVDDVSHLAAGRNGCQEVFFCKVHDILHKHKHFGGSKEENKLVENLRQFIRGFNKKCGDLLEKVTSNGVTTPVPTLLSHLVACSQNRNFNGTFSGS
ncbi:uncharacterized protein V6R79_001707 [Siganus canaliculatus]